ncbi:hypothetical protein [Nocardia sp. CA-119907]|uniref:hypothetical protein n=1 Tax=Nocardia sp. CA-119907 TaxID=3239973 RepID=UPI003D95A487
MKTRGTPSTKEKTPPATHSPSPPTDDPPESPSELTQEQLKRYGGILQHRRVDELKLSLRAAADLVQMAHTTLRDLELGTRAPARALTYRKLDEVYQYLPGSVFNLYNSGQQPLRAETPTPPPPPRVPTTDFPVVLPLMSVIELIEADQLLEDKAQTIGDPELLALRETYARCTDRLMRAWTIAQIEGRRAAGYQDDRFISTLLTAQLARKPVAPDEQDRDELTYLRWLLGRAGELPPDDEARYAALFATRTQGRTDADT